MITKDSFFRYFKDFDKDIISKLYDKVILAQKTNTVIYFKFFTYCSLYEKLKSIENNLDLKVYCDGGFEEFDRAMISLCNYETYEYFPINIIRIKNKSKFKELKHKDYLGSIMALGIKRELLGDLIVKDNYAYVPVVEDISEFIKNNLSSIGKCPCEVTILDDRLKDVPKVEYEEKSIIVTSLRLDNIISSLCNISRSNALEMLDGGKILVNYIQENKKDKNIVENDIITVRGYGKFKIGNIINKTKSDRTKLSIKKYK
ncbi:RNA-binding protein [Clostridium ihumii]|uniref:YlmH family RNA-binding protein n=1 Tax=Clostridium ihumii TaxID=1470356 RepID=UPI003D3502CF